jgi:predicted DNA-binding transcriptional regulator AlpA
MSRATGKPASTDIPFAPPPNRGRLLYVEDVRTEIFRGRKTAWWVRHNVAPDKKIKIGRDCAWYEADVYAWLEGLRASA